jgi:ATP-dependent Clp protease ATP-binding subunit ClpA
MTGIPLTRLEKAEAERLLQMDGELASVVINQTEAIHAIARAVRRSRSGLKDPRRPTGLVHLPRSLGRRKDVPREAAREVHVRQ